MRARARDATRVFSNGQCTMSIHPLETYVRDYDQIRQTGTSVPDKSVYPIRLSPTF